MQHTARQFIGLIASTGRQFAANTAAVLGISFKNAAAPAPVEPPVEPPQAVLDFSRCPSAWDASLLWAKSGYPELPCSPQELYWRGKPEHLRPAYWRDDPI